MEVGDTIPNSEKPQRLSFKDKLKGILEDRREFFFFHWNLSLWMAELFRDLGTRSPASEATLFEHGRPILSEGVPGFIDQHIGDSLEVLTVFYAARIPVALVSRAIEIQADKKIDPRVKLGVSLLLSSIIVAGAELSGRGNVPDPNDLVGVAAGVIWASVGYEVINRLFNPKALLRLTQNQPQSLSLATRPNDRETK